MSAVAAPILVPIQAPQLIATIHIGANAVSMLVGAPAEGGDVKAVDFFEQPVPLARDVFRAGRIGRSVMERCVRVLRDYRAALRELGIADGKPNRIVCTNILAEATNQDIFLNRIHVACGLEVDPLDDGEQTRLVYMKTQRLLASNKNLARARTMVIHVGPGNTRILLFQRGRIERYSSYRLGTHRSNEAVQSGDPHGQHMLRMLEEQSRASLDLVFHDYRDVKPDALVVIGYEMQAISPRILESKSRDVPVKRMKKFLDDLVQLSTDERVRRLHLDYASADSVIAAVLINLRLAETFGARSIHLPAKGFEHGLLADLPFSSSLSGRFEDEVLQSASTLAKRYLVDPRHARHVERLCTAIYDATAKLHQLAARDKLLLRVAATLHEVGNYITPKAHHKHSYYIIHNSEIFGLSATDIETVALVARYHRHSPPKPTHEGYNDLSRENRMRVCKMAAILRVADALDRPHAQRVRDITTRITDNKLLIGLGDVADAAIERLALADKGDLFQHIFGLEVSLEPGAV
jgi:exopolyphosphatase/guanosine-5'-triphosphate,3'-diphosphate pyrophosphatase